MLSTSKNKYAQNHQNHHLNILQQNTNITFPPSIPAKPPLGRQYVHHFPQKIDFKWCTFESTPRPAPRHLGMKNLYWQGTTTCFLKTTTSKDYYPGHGYFEVKTTTCFVKRHWLSTDTRCNLNMNTYIDTRCNLKWWHDTSICPAKYSTMCKSCSMKPFAMNRSVTICIRITGALIHAKARRVSCICRATNNKSKRQQQGTYTTWFNRCLTSFLTPPWPVCVQHRTNQTWAYNAQFELPAWQFVHPFSSCQQFSLTGCSSSWSPEVLWLLLFLFAPVDATPWCRKEGESRSTGTASKKQKLEKAATNINTHNSKGWIICRNTSANLQGFMQ